MKTRLFWFRIKMMVKNLDFPNCKSDDFVYTQPITFWELFHFRVLKANTGKTNGLKSTTVFGRVVIKIIGHSEKVQNQTMTIIEISLQFHIKCCGTGRNFHIPTNPGVSKTSRATAASFPASWASTSATCRRFPKGRRHDTWTPRGWPRIFLCKISQVRSLHIPSVFTVTISKLESHYVF